VIKCMSCGTENQLYPTDCGGSNIDPKCNVPSEVRHRHTDCTNCGRHFIVCEIDRASHLLKENAA